jgi:hypothetical protein
MEKVEAFFDRGVLHPGHPPIVDYATLATSNKDLKAGTVLKLSSGKLAPAGDSDTPCAVLLADVPAHTSETTTGVPVAVHGLVVKSRLLDYSSSSEAAASDTLTAKLPAAGIYLVQGGWSDSNFK